MEVPILCRMLFLFVVVAAVPLASRLGIGAVLGYICWQELQLVHGGWGFITVTSMRSSLPDRRGIPDVLSHRS